MRLMPTEGSGPLPSHLQSETWFGDVAPPSMFLLDVEIPGSGPTSDTGAGLHLNDVQMRTDDEKGFDRSIDLS